MKRWLVRVYLRFEGYCWKHTRLLCHECYDTAKARQRELRDKYVRGGK